MSNNNSRTTRHPKRRSNNNNNNSSQLLATHHNANPFKRVLAAIDEKSNSQTYMHRLSATGDVSGLVSGINFNLPLGGVSTAQDWSTMATLYDEFRVLGLKVHYQPSNRYTLESHPFWILYDNDQTSISPASNNVAASYANSKFVCSADPFTYTGIFAFTKDGPEVWINTNSPTTQLGVIGLFTTKAFASTVNIGTVSLEYVIECRGRR